MKSTKAAVMLTVLFVSAIVASSVDARGRRHHHHHHHHRGHVGIFFGVPAPIFYPRYHYYPGYYYPAPVAVAPAPVYIERSEAPSPSAPTESSTTAYWYYCRDSQTYYPYVQQCASPWERVVPHSEPPS